MLKLVSFEPHFAIQLDGEIKLQQNQINVSWWWKDLKNNILFPQADGQPQRRDELWKQTCFEVFIQERGSTSYYELNISPTGHWNCYAFEAYRKPQPPQASNQITLISHHLGPGELTTQWKMQDLPKKFLNISLNAILVLKNKETTYWALKHTPFKPDFHNPETFILERSFA